MQLCTGKFRCFQKLLGGNISIFVLSLCVLFNCCSCGVISKYNVDDIYGFWCYENEDDSLKYIAYIRDDVIDIFAVTKNTEMILSKQYWSGSFEIPEGSFSSYEWVSVMDYDRSCQDSDWTHDTPENINTLRVCFKADILHVYMYGLLDCEFERIDGFDKGLRAVEADDMCLEISDTLQDLEVLDINCFWSSTDPTMLFVALKVKNPNEYGIYCPEYVLQVQETGENITVQERGYLPPNSENIVVGWIYEDIVGLDIECQAYYNKYCVDVLERHTPVEVEGSSVSIDPETNEVTDLFIDVDIPENLNSYGDYHLNIVFYNDGEIVGVASSGGQYQNGSTTVGVSPFISTITEFDDYEIYVG